MTETDEITLHLKLRRTSEGSWRIISIAQDPSGDSWPGDPTKFGQAVTRARLRAGISQEALAQKAGVTTVTLRNAESAKHLQGLALKK